MSIFTLAAIVGLVLPVMCIVGLWRTSRPLAKAGIFFVGFLLIQILSEAGLARTGVTHFIKYTSAVFVLARLAHLLYTWSLKRKVAVLPIKARTFVTITYFANLGLWSYILCRLISKMLPMEG